MTYRRIDSHHHLWDPAAQDYPFLESAVMEPIRQAYGLDELRIMTADAGVGATILVQSLALERESAQLLRAAAGSDGLVAGVVGWADLLAADWPDRVERLRESDGGGHLLGLRHPAQAETDPEWLARPEVMQAVSGLGRLGLAFDLLVKRPQWSAALALARRSPGTRVVLDHAGSPALDDASLADWRGWIRKLASAGPHVYVKLSGLVTLADWSAWSVASLSPIADELFEVFGPGRVMAGSDWPICELAATAPQVWGAVESLVAGLGESERACVLGGTAAKAYSLGDPASG